MNFHMIHYHSQNCHPLLSTTMRVVKREKLFITIISYHEKFEHAQSE